MELHIDKEFAEKIPPLTKDEFDQLEANILADGIVINPLITWNSTIVDGHNRFRIIQAHPEIPFQVHEKTFADRYEAIAWICKNQLGRRNLTPAQRKYLIGKQYEAEKVRHGGDRKSDDAKSSYQNGNLIDEEKTCDRIARENSLGRTTVIRAEAYAAGIDAAEEILPGIRQEILSGTIRPPDKEIIAVARAPTEERKRLVEKLCQPKTPSKRPDSLFRDEEQIEPEDSEEKEDAPFTPSTASILSISAQMDSSSDRGSANVDTEFIIYELENALSSMIFRWESCISDYRKEAMAKDCQQKIKELVVEGIRYLQQYRGGVRNETGRTCV